jgi:hypothetical protein
MLSKTSIFEFFQRLGIHVLRNSYSNPIPDTRELSFKENFWEKESELIGINMNLNGQLNFLKDVFPQYLKECNFPKNKTKVPYQYYTNNWFFGLVSASVLHCMIRHFTPRTIVEVGSGYSTYVSAGASLLNQEDGYNTELIAIEPYPNYTLTKGFPGLSRLIVKKVEDVNRNLFSQLKDGDILFVDSSHVVKIANDVTFLYLEVFSRLKKGVIIHIHDIFFPFNYPKEFVINQRMFWNEQYLLQAFLIFNDAFEVLWSENYIRCKAYKHLELAFPGSLGFDENRNSSSFWMRKAI